VNDGHRDSPALLSAAPATTPHNRAALAVMLAVLVVLCATLPFAQRLWPPFPGFILIQQPLQAMNCIIIAALLFGQYSITRAPSLNLVAAGYLFTALMIIAHTLSFPGAFSETGLFPGGVHTTSWLYPAWHTILPFTIIVYFVQPPLAFAALGGDRDRTSRNVQIVFASGTVSPSPRRRKRMNDSRSRIRYSVRSSDRL
jgi:Membrane-associated sensor, integral membrane domain